MTPPVSEEWMRLFCAALTGRCSPASAGYTAEEGDLGIWRIHAENEAYSSIVAHAAEIADAATALIEKRRKESMGFKEKP